MTLLNKIVTGLLCTVAPTALIGQAVELRSSDGFISVEGEITGFNGMMVAIQTTVGLVSVPASEVVCYGEGCTEILASNDFGLTAESFAGVVASLEAPVTVLSDDLTLGLASSSYDGLYRALAGAFADSEQTTMIATLDDAGQLALQNAEGSETAVLRLAQADAYADADIKVLSVPLSGTATQAYAAPRDWALAQRPGHQMLGLRAFAVVAAADVGVDAITMDQLAAIYAGEITNWSQIDGADQPIIPLQLPAASDLRRDIVNIVMAPAGKTIADGVLTIADEAGIVNTIADIAGSISLVSLTSAGTAQTLPVAGTCGLAVEPTDFAVRAGDYPLVRPLMAEFVTTPQTSLIPTMFDFAATDVAQSLLGDAGFVVGTSGPQAEADKAARLGQLLSPGLDSAERPVAAQMLQTLFEAERLTPTMFGGAVSAPEAGWNRSMMNQLVALLLQPQYAGREVIFAGFGTSDAGAQDAIDQSARAAADMLGAFNAFAPAVAAGSDLTLTSAGFGAVAPAACYDGQVDGAVHTRVEVWVK